jgi:hypothetical protein
VEVWGRGETFNLEASANRWHKAPIHPSTLSGSTPSCSVAPETKGHTPIANSRA